MTGRYIPPSFCSLNRMSLLTEYTNHRTLTSAVALPEPDQNQGFRDSQLKRQQSISGDTGQKRRRLSTDGGSTEHGPSSSNKADSLANTRPGVRRKPGKKDEERKRGQRLFGALLGTLSQSSSSTSQKRRAEIDRKQQDKLKQQDQEYSELTEKRRDEILAERRRQQKLFDEQSVCKIALPRLILESY